MTTATVPTMTFNGASPEAIEALDSIQPPWRMESAQASWHRPDGGKPADWPADRAWYGKVVRAYKIEVRRITGPAICGPMGTGDEITVYFLADGSPVPDPETMPWGHGWFDHRGDGRNGGTVPCDTATAIDLLRALVG